MIRKSNVKFNWKITAVASWLIFTLSLAGWWLIFGLQQNEQLLSLADATTQDPELRAKILRQSRMLFWEGMILLLSLLGGGVGLFYFIHAEMKQNRMLKEFFATFSHEIKTSLTSLRLQAESLKEDLEEERVLQSSSLLERLVGDTIRLEIQLENSLFLANQEQRKWHPEKVVLREALEHLSHSWPDLKISCQDNAELMVDERAFESICKNLLYNSIYHGEASEVRVDVVSLGSRVRLAFNDNGNGFSGDVSSLGQLFFRPQSTSGSGLGLYLVKRLAREMSGQLLLVPVDQGFRVELTLPGKALDQEKVVS